jgi:hypothetical protein
VKDRSVTAAVGPKDFVRPSTATSIGTSAESLVHEP